jgi:hypothetical protein
MTTFTNTPATPLRLSVNHSLRQAWATNRLLTMSALLHVALIPLVLLAAVVDPKTIMGQPAWIKPLKFAISISVYSFTFLWLLSYVQGFDRAKRIAANTTAVAFLVESIIIIGQVVRGTTSHFNNTTPFDAALYQIMGGFITLVAMADLLVAIVLIRQRLPDRAFTWSLRLGVLLAFVGMAVAFLMTSGPTPEQRARMEAGEIVTSIGAHSVGVEDGGPGLPLLGWSTEGGDLRVPHFVGLHGLQLLPFVGWLLTRPALRRRLPAAHRLLLVWIAGLGYLGLTILFTWQALRGQSIVAPDFVTWRAFGVLLGSVVLASGATWLHGRGQGTPTTSV